MSIEDERGKCMSFSSGRIGECYSKHSFLKKSNGVSGKSLC